MLLWVVFALTWVSALLAMIGAASVPVSDPDVWWVAAAGRGMLSAHAVPSQNLFSFVEPTHAWIMHEWGLGPLYALGLTRWGPAFFVAVAIAALSVGLFAIARATLGRASQPLAGALLACISTLFFLRRLQTARPTCVSLLFPLLLTWQAFAPNFTRTQLIVCVLCEWLWANVHGSFPIGLLLLAAAAIEQPRDRKRRVIAVALAALLTLLNPYGAHLHAFVWSYFTGSSGIYREIHAAIPEFASLWTAWGSLIELPELLGFAAVASMALAALRKTETRWRGLLCVGLLWLAVRQARHLELAGLLSCMLLVPWADAWVASWGERDTSATGLARRMQHWLVWPICALGVVVFSALNLQRKPTDWIDQDLAYLAALPAVASAARLYVPFRAAGVAIWQGYPRGIRVFYDSRNDCYSVSTLRNFAALGKREAQLSRTRAILDASGTDTVLVPLTHALATTLAGASEWQPARVPQGMLFRRKPALVANGAEVPAR